MEEATGAPSSLTDLDPKRLRASGRDGGGIVNQPPSSLSILFSRHTKRREFSTLIAGAAATLPLWTMLPYVAHAAPPARSVTIGIIAPLSFPAVEGLRKGFRELGYIEGRNLRLEHRWAEGPTERYVSVARELLQLGVDAIVTWGTPATMGARQATATLPIVTAAVGDPVAAQLVPNLARPDRVRASV